MARKISIRCPSCDARIKAPVELIGEIRNCPGCDLPFLVEDPRSRKASAPEPASSQPVLITQSETVDMRLELGEAKSGQQTSLEELDAQGVRARDMVAQFYKTIGGQDDRAAS